MYDGLWFGDGDVSPLQKLARRILLVCANSALCERLFSMFGLTLTCHRSWLQTTALTNLAELRMHLCDEHLHNGTTKAWLSRNITSHNAHPLEASTGPTETQLASSTSNQGDNDANEPESNANMGPNTFRNVITRLVESAAEDDHDGSISFCDRKVKISALFDFGNSHWRTVTQAHSLRGLREELELHELLDLDAEGEADPLDSVDGMTGAML